MPAYACARAPPLAAAAGRRRRRCRAGLGSGFGFRFRFLPYLAWFFLNRVSRVWAAPLPEPDPLRYPDPNRPANGPAPRLLECQQL